MKDIKVVVEKITRNRRKVIGKPGDSLLCRLHSIQLSSLGILFSMGETQHYVTKLPKSTSARHYCSKLLQVPSILGKHMVNLIFSVLSFIKLSFIYIKRAANGNCVLTFQMFLLAKNVPYTKVINISMTSVVEYQYWVCKIT